MHRQGKHYHSTSRKVGSATVDPSFSPGGAGERPRPILPAAVPLSPAARSAASPRPHWVRAAYR
jgi:hypothetical protein